MTPDRIQQIRRQMESKHRTGEWADMVIDELLIAVEREGQDPALLQQIANLQTATATAAGLLRFIATNAANGHNLDIEHVRAAADNLTAIATL
ncbi:MULTISPECIES: hypothetical protein [unclassified Streptomyces]|uniref:hypothetical protein n=1 Tax=unclassified Streptomyces TaxID=2593676 RepID=UPI0022506AD4|nr:MULTISPECIES: hypothetical protein [unclassified Streptomyces]MCX4871117.1 hypothetical protein [Streptomyces sp. NBC_00906]MCX4902739.1 hypothetical protein [Streptomyces sp. NBC_00892]